MWAIVFAAFAGAVTVAGILLLKAWHREALRYSHYINSFAAGLILAAAISALLPRALSLNEHAPLLCVAGFAAFLVLESFLVMHSGAEVHYPQRTAARGMVYFWGLFIHSLLDGIIIAVGFAAGHRVGLMTSLAVIGHELPEGVTTFSLLLQKIEERRALVMSLAVAVATPAGAVVGVAVLPALREGFVGAALAVVAGSFLYIAASDIVPEIREEKAIPNTAFLVAGIALLAILHHLVAH
ncbi:MAG: ZIP family metal transporter [Planctomycetota bacterium]|jgi:ZIP family zinc transporter/zinc and cadmium transporter